MSRIRSATPSQRLIDRRQGEEIYGIPARTIYDLITSGVLPVVRFPGSRKHWIERTDLENLINRSKETYA